MFLLVLALVAAEPADLSPPSRSAGEGRHGPVVDEGPAPAWQYFAVPAGLSLTSSVLLSPIIVLLPIATTTTTVALTIGPPAVAVVGTGRLGDDPHYVVAGGVIVGDVVGVLVGAGAGYVVWYNFARDVGDSFYIRVAVAGALIYSSAAVARAALCGVGGVVGHLVSTSASED